ncbi:LysR family transcriptional regulator [Paenibacillus hamazuiensis]|uniref:LysR family transcriptional regulator n=1 Tax=Paenibacillus hamazuiensis TaxID=2936508 RepID=UPI00200E279B|nr:LysR family transcriptional regulator [Paenibacillus hamazuiensis]
MDERDWMIIHVLYEKKNITKAAQSLFITQPALTKRLMVIEEELGVKIVNRGIRGVHFTPQGEYLAKRASELLSLYRDIREDLTNMTDEVIGTIRLGVSTFFSKYKLPIILRLFKEQYPKAEFHVETLKSQDIFNLVYNQEVHVGFVRGGYSWPGRKHLLFQEKIYIVSKFPVDFADLPNVPKIDYQTDNLFKSLIDNWWADHFSKPPLVAMKVDRGDTGREMVVNGLGYAILPAMFINDIPDLHKLEVNDKNNNPILRETWMFYYEESLSNNVVKAFVEFVEGLDLQDISALPE